MTSTTEQFQSAISAFDALNSQDPNVESFEGKNYPKELLYAQRMTQSLSNFAPTAPEALHLAARCQHLCRWEIPRSAYPLGRKGYNQWRSKLRTFHAEKAGEVLEKVGYESETIDRVKFLVLKKQLKRDADTQTLEDVICLVFLEHYFTDFASKHPEEKVLDILRKTWRKMSNDGQAAALTLPLSAEDKALIEMALA
ncbi:MAG: DUF4202 domain-containing protein [Bacteroidota bacterium]